jgi:hypothetical protein
LVCVVEGKGDRMAMPNLCSRIRDYLQAWDWFVDPDPVRQDRGRLVDMRLPGPRRPALRWGLERAVLLAAARPASGVLVVCDEDDDCAGEWGPSADQIIAPLAHGCAVMIVREYETWLLHSAAGAAERARGSASIESKRDAKAAMRRIVPGYKPTTHQLRETQKLNIPTVWAASDSFDKLMRSLARIFDVTLPRRPARR